MPTSLGSFSEIYDSHHQCSRIETLPRVFRMTTGLAHRNTSNSNGVGLVCGDARRAQIPHRKRIGVCSFESLRRNKQRYHLQRLLSIVYLNRPVLSRRHDSRSLLVEGNRPHDAIVAAQRLHRVIRLQGPHDHFPVRSTTRHAKAPLLPRCQILLIRGHRNASHPAAMTAVCVLDQVLLGENVIADDALVIRARVQPRRCGKTQTTHRHRVVYSKPGLTTVPL